MIKVREFEDLGDRLSVGGGFWVRELQMGFLDVAFLPSLACLHITFQTHCGRG